jgi:hypothetical protein
VFNADLPDDEDAALAYLDAVKQDTLAPAEPASSD